MRDRRESVREAPPGAEPSILEPGRNCWRVDRADKMRCIQDAAEYFRLVRHAMLGAEHTIFTLGWDTSPHTDLLPGETPADGPTRLDDLIAWVARRRPALRCHVLTWDYGVVHFFERDPFTRWRLGWRMPDNVLFAFDDHHALGGCHHQKVVVVDDRLAFVGGIDLTGHRWDTAAHRVNEPARVSLDGDVYGPYHEVQAMVSGPIAAALGVLARDRWRALGHADLPPVSPSQGDPWPQDVVPDLTGVPAAIVRTMPGLGRQQAVTECEALYVDSIAKARDTIYLESQYFTNDRLASALAARLEEPDGPEVIAVMPKCCDGWLEETTMGALREGVMRQLAAADVHGRLRLVYPAASQSRDVPTFVHSKVMFIDDRLARIGSSNLSKRSMGVDSECDLAIDSAGNPDIAAGILTMRNRLIAEHLGITAADVARETDRGRSLRSIIDGCASADHTLARLPIPETVAMPPAAVIAAADPEQPIAMDVAMTAAVEGPLEFARARPATMLVVAAAGALGLGLAVAGGRRRSISAGGVVRSGAAAALLFAGWTAARAWAGARKASRLAAEHRKRAEFG
jgi:phosphatidylserine/phosphatidylglycerophosphate/cardiolipin synthase-like enzyme